MIKLISKVLKRYSDANLHSETARLIIARDIIKEMKEDSEKTETKDMLDNI